jgi:hypothetical protein
MLAFSCAIPLSVNVDFLACGHRTFLPSLFALVRLKCICSYLGGGVLLI